MLKLIEISSNDKIKDKTRYAILIALRICDQSKINT